MLSVRALSMPLGDEASVLAGQVVFVSPLKLMARSQSKAPYIAQFAVSNECIYLICGTGRQIIYTSKFL